ncbi:CBS domain-containing protein, partial [Toxoplasma gondii GAB2-2007-GAL-DOM2]
EVRKLLQFFGRGLYAVDDDTPLLELLKTFKQGHTHLAVVRRVSDDGEGDPFYIHVGIITLEDVMEEILQDEINDEFEHDKSQSHRRRRHQNQAVSGAQASLPYFAPSSPLAPRFSVSSTAWEAQGDVDTAPEAESRRSRREKKKEKVKGDKRRFRLWSRGRRSSTASSNAPLTNACEKEAGEGTDGDVEDKRVDRNEASRRPSKEASFPATCASTLQARRPGEAETDLLSGGSPVGLSSFEKSSECGDPERGSLGEASSRHSRWTAKRLEEGGAVESHFLEDEPTRELPRGDTEEGEGQRRRSRGGAAGEKTIKTVEMTPLEPMHAVLTTSREEPPKAEEIRREDALGHPSLFPWWGWSADTAGSVSKLRMRGTLRMFFDSHRRSRIAEPLTESEARAIASFLSSSIPAFSPQIVDEKLLVSLLSSFFCIQPPPASLLWHSAVHPDLFKHKSTDKRGEHEAAFEPFAVIVLYGRVRLYVGKEGIPCTAGPLSCLAVKKSRIASESSSPSLHDASSGGVFVEEAPQGSQTKSPSTGRSEREKTACDVDSACVEIDIGNRRASTFEKDAFRRKETYPQFGDTERSCRKQNEMLSWLRTSATSSVSLESGEEDVELTAPSQAHSHVRLEEVCVCGVSLSLPWLSPKKGTDREQRRRAREEGLCLGLSREEPPEGESSVEGTSLEKKEEQSAGASAGRRRLPSEKSSLAFPAFSSQRLSGKSIFRRETAGTGVSEISHLLRFEKPQADWSAARGPEPGPRREREEERQEELSCGWGANRQEGPAKPRVQQSLEEQLQIQETCLRQLAKDMQEKKGVWLAVSSKQRGKQYQRRRDVEFVDEQDKAERSSQAKSEREGREKQDASARGAAETGEAGAENEEPEGDGKKRIQEVRNREALCHEIHSWVQSLQDSKGGSEARGNEWSNEQTKTLTCEGYAPDYTAVTEGACGLLVFPRWFYVAAVKASLDLARSSRS